MPITRAATGLRRSPRLASTRKKQQKKKTDTRKKVSKVHRTKNKARKTRTVQRKAYKARNARRPSVQQRKLSKYTRKELSAFFHTGEERKGRKRPKHRTKCIHWRNAGITPGSTLSVMARCRARSPLYLNDSRSRKCPGKWQYLSRNGELNRCYKGKGPFVRRRVSSKWCILMWK